MKLLVGLLVGICIFQLSASGQYTYTIKGRIFDENRNPLPGAAVLLNPGNTGVISNTDGGFRLSGLKAGEYDLNVSLLGYEGFRRHISLQEDIDLNIQLSQATLPLGEVVVAYRRGEQRKKESPLSIEILKDDYLKQNTGGSLMKSLERLPGVTTIDIGSGQSKPVIRGLGFNRVVVVENGIKHEAQQWGDEHGLEIDQYSIDNVEIIKGPASLMYGSDAIGGVIEINSIEIPSGNSTGGTIDLYGRSNNNLLGTSASLYGRNRSFFAGLRATILDYGDYIVPTDSVDIYSYRAALHKNHLRNTAGREQNLHFSFGIIRPSFQSKFYISNIHARNGFFANTHGLEPRNVDTRLHDRSSRDIHYPYQQVNHFKAINRSQWRWNKYKLESDLGFQRNFRQEWSQYVNHGYMPAVFPGSMGFDANLERRFDKYIYSGNLKLTREQNDRTSFTLGINSDYQGNRIDGRGFIIPAFKQTNVGGLILGKHSFTGKSIIQIGIRYDYGNIRTLSYYDWFQSPVISGSDTLWQYLQRSDDINRNFSSISWSAGYNYNPESWSFKVNIGKSFRMPIAKELAANGVNYHRFSYEAGNPDLSPEISYQIDAGIERSSEKLTIEITPFLNYFSNYIYLNPTSEHDRLYGNGNQIYYYTQSEVLRYGGEIHAGYQLLKPLQLGVTGEYVYQEQLTGEKKGFTLPFSPPASILFNVRFQKTRIKFIENAYLSVDYRITASQNNIVPPEETTDGYQVINAGLGGEIKPVNQKVNFSLQVQNLLNSKYFNHTSYYRLINVPEPGRNFILNISIPFSGKIKRSK